nr:hypothetical protein Iba_chr01fCG7460 [Ipomoea batatas]
MDAKDITGPTAGEGRNCLYSIGQHKDTIVAMPQRSPIMRESGLEGAIYLAEDKKSILSEFSMSSQSRRLSRDYGPLVAGPAVGRKRRRECASDEPPNATRHAPEPTADRCPEVGTGAKSWQRARGCADQV